MTVGGGSHKRPARHHPIVWPRDCHLSDDAQDSGVGFIELIERRPELGDMFVPRIAAAMRESV